jgi:ankyrin repeat protein
MSDIYPGKLPLHVAVEDGDMELVRQRLAEGADLEAVEEWNHRRAALGIASEKGHVDVVRLLLASGADPNGSPQSDHGPLQDAVASGNVEIVQMLLDHGAQVNATDTNGWHALLCAVCRIDLEPDKPWPVIVRLLIAAGGDIHLSDTVGRTPLVVAAEQDPSHAALEVMRILLEAGADCNVIVGDNTCTALTSATEEGNIEAVRLLLEAGADVNFIDGLGDTAWNQARRQGYAEIAALLEQAGAVEPEEVRQDLHKAILWGNAEAVEHLLEQGADANARDADDRPALLNAIDNWDKEEIVRLLLDHGAAVNVGIPLMAAVQGYRPRTDPHAVVRLLIERGADVNAAEEDGRTALYVAAQTPDTEILRLLLEAGADVNAWCWYGRTALMEAAHSGRYANVALLLAHGADVNAKAFAPPGAEYCGGTTALIQSEPLDVARLLLEHGADVDIVDDAGYTALMWEAGAHYGSEDSEAWKASVARIRLLLEWGADVNRQNIHKDTALDYAVGGMWAQTDEDEGEWSEIAHLLAQAGAVRGEPRPRWCYMAVSEYRCSEDSARDQ